MTPTKEPLLIYEIKNTIFSVYRRHELTQKWKEFEFNVRGFNQQNNLCEVHSLGESMVAEEEGEEGDHGHQLPPELGSPKKTDEFIVDAYMKASGT